MRASARIDAAAVRHAVPLAELIGRYTALTRNGHEFTGLCPFHAETTPSFSVVPAKGFYHCFGCGAHGDAIGFIIELLGVGFREACAIIAGGNAVPLPKPIGYRAAAAAADVYDGYVPVVPVPAEAPAIVAGKRTAAILNPKRADDPEKREQPYRPSMVFPYRSADGDLIGYVLRIDLGAGRKVTPAVMFCDTPEGARRWCLRPFPEPRPLYNLLELAALPDATAVVVEGEKAADAAQRLIPGNPCVTWPGGAQSHGRADWRPLAGRRVAIWPDADDVGRKAALDIAERLTSLRCLVTVAYTGDLPDGFDAADLPPDCDGPAWLRYRLRRFYPTTQPRPIGGAAA